MPGTEDENPDLYQGLEKGKRAQSVFICPSCNANSDYQRLSRPGHCPHVGNQEREGKSRSIYQSLTTERGARESVYMNPSRNDEVRIFLFSFRPFFLFISSWANQLVAEEEICRRTGELYCQVTDFGTNGPIRFLT